MPSIRNTYGLDACTTYTLRVCGDEPCEYHRAVDAAKKRGITLNAYMEYQMQTNGSLPSDEENDE